MSTKKQTNVEIASRLLELVEEHTGGNAKKFALNAGIGSVTFYNYLKGRVPKADTLENICKFYKVNLNWLVAGIGPKYITDQAGSKLDPDPEIAELMEGARRVLKSGNPVAFDALERNIRYFDYAIRQEKRMAEMERRLARLEEERGAAKTPPEEDQSPGEKAA